MLAWQTERFTEPAVEDDGWVVTVRPVQVVEIAFDGVQRSSGASSVAERTPSRRAHRSSSSACVPASETPALAHEGCARGDAVRSGLTGLANGISFLP
jgi:hypothetical protein